MATYEALVKEVKLLKEEIKQLRNEKKETNRSTVDVCIDSKLRDRKASRNSWMEIYHNNTVRRKSMKLLGEDIEIDDWLDLRVKWAQRGIGFFSLITLTCFVAGSGEHELLMAATAVFALLVVILFGVLYYKNVSIVIVKRLSKESNVVIILILGIVLLIGDIGRPASSFSPIFGIIYMLGVTAFVFLDAIKLKSRILVIIIGSLFILLNIYNIYGNIFLNWNKDLILFKYTINGEEYTFMKRSTKRAIYLQVLSCNRNCIEDNSR